MAAWRRAIELSLGDSDTAKLRSIAQSRTEPASRVERARILLAYREDPSFFAVGRALGLHHQTVQRCVERAVVEGPMAALDDRPRPGREPTITLEAKAWLVSLACRKAKDLGYPHELWTTRLLASHAREHGPAQGHACLAHLAQGPSGGRIGRRVGQASRRVPLVLQPRLGPVEVLLLLRDLARLPRHPPRLGGPSPADLPAEPASFTLRLPTGKARGPKPTPGLLPFRPGTHIITA